MLKIRGLGVLAVPAAVSLAGVLVVACMEGNPTAPDGASTPSLAPTKTPLYDDPKGSESCKGNDIVLRPISEFYQDGYDANNNDVICLRTSGPGPKK
jgi:hypothetical protein